MVARRGGVRVVLLVATSVSALCAWALWYERPGDPAVEERTASNDGSEMPSETAVAVTFTAPPRESPPGPPTWNWQYDDDGRVARLDGPGGGVTRFVYGRQANQPAGPVASGERRVFTLDREGRLVKAAGAAGTTTFSYRAGEVPTDVRSDGLPNVSYVHDVWGRPSETRIGANVSIRRRYDYLGRLAAIETPGGDITFTYDLGSDTVVRRLPNGVRTLRKYDDEGRLAELIHVDARDRIIARYTYTYRADGLIAAIVEASQRHGERAWQYSYDPMHRLTAVERPGAGAAYTFLYDTAGNLIESRAADGRQLRFASTPAGALTFDSRGASRLDGRGLVRLLPASAPPIEYDFNSAGELSAADDGAVRYSYNALGVLVGRTVAGRETRFLPDPLADAWRPLWQSDPDGLETITVWDGAVPLMNLATGGDVRYQLEDHLGSIRTEIDGGGRPIAWYDFTPYGEPTDVGTAGDALSPRFAGLFWDPVAKVYHVMSRAYDPVSARFLQPDPKLRIPDHAKENHSLYAYASGDPLNFVDLNGREQQPPDRVWLNAFFTELFGGLWRSWSEHAVAIEEVRSSFARHGFDGLAWGPQPGSLADQAARHGGRPAQLTVQALAGTSLAALGVATGAGAHQLGSSALQGFIRRGLHYGNSNEPFHFPLLPNSIRYLSKFPQPIRELFGNPHLGVSSKFGRHIASGVHHLYTTHYYNATTQTAVTVAEMAAGAGQFATRVAPLLPLLPGLPAAEGAIEEIDNWLVRPAYGDEIRPTPSAGLPSPVGGVFLGGAASALEGFGRLHGVAIDDATGRLVLIGSDERRIALPPLRLEDIVTVFRAVFLHGVAPSVTIDPDEANPTGPIMHVKHGPSTAATYVGWVLFECDRLMKTYQLGQDNITGQRLASKIEGHGRTLDAVYFGDAARGSGSDPRWERFWIVPAVTRFDGEDDALSLFELPLTVRTQRMRWQRGRLVDDERGGSSAGAMAFTAWFSSHYDQIADEALAMPPRGSNVKGPVAVFHELRRIAMVAAVAERLRDSGQKMPAWMEDYPVAPFPIPATTPSLKIDKSRQDGASVRLATIYGGVDLAPADRDVHRYDARGSAGPVPQEHAEFVAAAKRMASSLATRIHELARNASTAGSVQTIEVTAGPPLSVAFLPGADTGALAPNRQQVTDLLVPVGTLHHIALTRHYNSFFDVPGEYGKGWTLDLPRLVKTQVPVRRDGKRTQSRVVPYLVSPLRTVDVVFDRTAKVDAYGIEMAFAPNRPDIAGVAGGYSEIIGGTTDQIRFHDGTSWHFDASGALVLVQADGVSTRYVRDRGGRILSVVGYAGNDALAAIHLTYDGSGRIVEAVAAQAPGVTASAGPLRFEYDDGGRLSKVVRGTQPKSAAPSLEWSYAYQSGRLARIGSREQPDCRFEYNERGQLLRDIAGDRTMTYRTSESAGRVTLTVGDGGSAADTWVYDAQMRPLELRMRGGDAIRWRYGNGREVQETLVRGGRVIATRTTSADGRVETTVSAGGPAYEVKRDASGFPTSLAIGGVSAVSVVRQADGSFAGLRTSDTELHLRRHRNGVPAGLLISAPMDGGKTSRWLEQHWDATGQPVRLTESSGVEFHARYDAEGRLAGVQRTGRDGRTAAATLARDGKGRITRVNSAAGSQRREYSAAGTMRQAIAERRGMKAMMTFDDRGRRVEQVGFDGGRTAWTYEAAFPGATPRRIELPGGTPIDYEWSRSTDASAAEITFGTGVVRARFDTQGRPVSLAWGAARQ
jgi:RHS repeat-associated protein